DRKTLWRARHGRGREAAIVNVWLERIAGLVAARYARQRPYHPIYQTRRYCLVEIGRWGGENVCRDLVAINVRPRKWRVADNLNRRQGDSSLSPSRPIH